ncbi:MAG: hypothetical protein BA874_11250 [Desulfuromonadales bacterium C00003068]|nr:MAG: hypothetical protein BA874_11250 [Desulfuromonadales bacterium C00003068]
MGRPNLKKKVIEEAAIELFATKGLARTVIRDIAQAAQVTEGALYRHYKSKDELAWSLFQREIDRFTVPFSELLLQPGSASQLLEAAVQFIYDYYQQQPIHFTFILLTQHGFPDASLRQQTNPNDIIIRFISQLLDQPNDQHAVLMAALVMGLVMQPVVMHGNGRLTTHPVDCVAEVTAAVCRVLNITDLLQSEGDEPC